MVSNRSKSRAVTTALAIAALAYLLTFVLMEKRAFWVIDNANKYLQLRSILKSGFTDYSLPWPGEAINPAFRFNPFPQPFAIVSDGKLYPVFSPVFATISAPLYALFGMAGLFVIPLISTLLMLVGLARLARTIGYSPSTAAGVVLAAGLLTPIWFYSAVFWEHTPAVCLAVWGVVFFAQYVDTSETGALAAGSVLAALSVYFRDELYLFCGVLLVVSAYSRREGRLRTVALGAALMTAALVPLWLFQWYAIGRPFGFHLASHILSSAGLAEFLATRPEVIYNLYIASAPNILVSMILAAPFLAVFVWNPRFERDRFRFVMPLFGWLALASGLVNLGGYHFSHSPISWMFKSNALFTTAPFLVFAFIGERRTGRTAGFERWLWLILAGYAGVYGILAPALGSSGIHWGNRFVLVLYPLIAVLAAGRLASWWTAGRRPVWGTAAVALCLGLSLAAQVYSLRLLHEKRVFSLRLNRTVQARPEEVIVTNTYWVSQELFTVFFERPIFLVSSQDEYRELTGILGKAGYRCHLFIVSDTGGRTPPGTEIVRDDALNAFTVYLVPMELPGE